jgi:hypothetical protein
MPVWYSLWSFGIFSHFGIFGPRKIWQPWFHELLMIRAAKPYWDAANYLLLQKGTRAASGPTLLQIARSNRAYALEAFQISTKTSSKSLYLRMAAIALFVTEDD